MFCRPQLSSYKCALLNVCVYFLRKSDENKLLRLQNHCSEACV